MNCPWQFAEPKETSNGRCLVCCQACGAILKIPCENDPARITGCRLKAQLRHKVRGKPWLHNLGDHVAVMLAQIGITKERYRKAKEKLGLGSSCGCEKRQEALNEAGRAISESF
jgi:hypothetical protein